ncbi:MAG: DUF1207 domain-containing protein [Nitrospirota bacterium]
MPIGMTFGRCLAAATAVFVWLVGSPWIDRARAMDVELLPGPSPFRPLLADPREAYHSLRYVVGSGRAGGEASFGDTFGLARVSNDRGIQVGLQASVFTRFNRDTDSAGFLDINSADYTIFIPVDFQFGRVAVRTGFGHTSSHLGEIEVQRRILNGEAMFYDRSFLYRRDYARVVTAWDVTDRARVYGGGSVAVHLTPEGGRTALQAGAEWTGRPRPWGMLARQWFAGVDLQTWAESDWAVNANVEGGLRLSRPDAARGIRLAVSGYAGRSLQRVLASEREQYVSVGLVFEF